MVLERPIIIARNRLQALVEAHANHYEQHRETVHDTVGANGKVAAVLAELLVHEKRHQAGGHIHQERPDTDRKRLPGHRAVKPENGLAEMQEAALVGEEIKRVAEGGNLAKHRGKGGAAYAHTESKNEHRIQYRIGNHREKRQSHRRAGMPRATDYAVESVHQVGESIAQDDDGHIVPRERQGVFTGPEEIQYRIQESQGHHGEKNADYGIEREGIGQHLPGRLVVLLPQQYGNQRHCAHAHECAEGDADVHQGEGHGKAGDCVGAHIGDVPDVDAVHHVIQRSSRLGYDARDGVPAQKSAYFFGSEFKRSG